MFLYAIEESVDCHLLSSFCADSYCLVNNISRLLSNQISKHNHKRFFCLRCHNSFTKKKVLDKNLEYCEKHDSVKITMPQKGTILEFKNHKRSMRVPIAVYADFESFTKPISGCEPNPEKKLHQSLSKA